MLGMTLEDVLDNGSTTTTCSNVEKNALDNLTSSGGSSNSRPCTRSVSGPPMMTALSTAVLDFSDVSSQKPCNLTLRAAQEPNTAATDLVPLTVVADSSAVERSPAADGSQLQQLSTSSSLVRSSSTDVVDDDDVAVTSPRYGVAVVTGLPVNSRPATCFVDDRRFFSPLIVHRAVACPYPIPLSVVGAHTGCFIEPQRYWWPQPPLQSTVSTSSSSLQTIDVKNVFLCFFIKVLKHFYGFFIFYVFCAF